MMSDFDFEGDLVSIDFVESECGLRVDKEVPRGKTDRGFSTFPIFSALCGFERLAI